MLKRIFSTRAKKPPTGPTIENQTNKPGSNDSTLQSLSTSKTKAQVYIRQVKEKINKLGDEYASGDISRTQFKELYRHYQKEVQTISTYLAQDPTAWQAAATAGESIMIRKQHRAKTDAYAIYNNLSGIPIYTRGKFKVDPSLLVPMLSSYRSVTNEVFGGGIRTMQIDGGTWLCFVPGKWTTTLAMISNEPSAQQVDFLGELHNIFERANQKVLVEKQFDTDDLVFPHEF